MYWVAWICGWQLVSHGPPLAGQASCVNGGDTLLTFGGMANGGVAVADLWSTSDGKEWRLHSTSDGPAPRMYAASAVVGDEMVVCGGWDPAAKGSGGVFFDDVWTYDLRRETWTQRTALPDGTASRHLMLPLNGTHALVHTFRCAGHVLLYDATTGRVVPQPTTGDGPDALSMQCGARTSTGVVLVGGSSRSQEMTSDVFTLDTTTWHWRTYVLDGPSARASSSLCELGDDAFLLFGGAELDGEYNHGTGLVARNDTWRLDLSDADHPKWERCYGTIDEVRPRVAAVLARLGTTALLCGGWNPQEKAVLEETHRLRLA